MRTARRADGLTAADLVHHVPLCDRNTVPEQRWRLRRSYALGADRQRRAVHARQEVSYERAHWTVRSADMAVHSGLTLQLPHIHALFPLQPLALLAEPGGASFCAFPQATHCTCGAGAPETDRQLHRSRFLFFPRPETPTVPEDEKRVPAATPPVI